MRLARILLARGILRAARCLTVFSERMVQNLERQRN
jgi:hypothetical protein